MKKLLAALIGLSAVASSASAQTPTPRAVEFYVQPSALVVFPGEFKDTAGGSLAVGATFAQQHSVEFEAIYFNTRTDHFASTRVIFVPLLATYKYRGTLTEKLSWHAGASIGATVEDARQTYYYWSAEKTTTAFTYGFEGGVMYALTSRLSLDVSGKLLHLNESGLTTDGNISMFGVGLHIRL